MSESPVQAAIRCEAARLGAHLWRNNVGVLPDARGVPVRFGLGNDSARVNDVLKSSDLIGIYRGKFVAIEVKAPGWNGPRTPRERAQEAFINLVRLNGGLAGFASCVEDLYKILGLQ